MYFAEFSKDLSVRERLPFQLVRLEDKDLPRVRLGEDRYVRRITVLYADIPSSKSSIFQTDCIYNWLHGGMAELSTMFVLRNQETGAIFGCSLTYDHYVYQAIRLRVASNERELLEGFFAFWDSAQGVHDDRNRIIHSKYFPNWLTA